ncbi:MAG: type II toxin-antitoxin system prevent-host-death family antitoxin [Azonexus sp.]|nr:type II toxin-antitoxin system prevent-host-death family antitoxin [Azonexus sp.]MDP3636525.1 type II toxin-antitoxin system prevent-host-death family antitoxin [Azonexus sp.]MDZ4317080.1 type II toxin-antitoxin system prevent-host-death family antitoxin [Azonexus sp.]
MDAMTYSYTRQHFADIMDRVNDDHAPLLITRQQGKPVVMMSLDDYNALEETAYLLRSPANAQRLIESVEQLRSGHGKTRALASDAD